MSSSTLAALAITTAPTLALAPAPTLALALTPALALLPPPPPQLALPALPAYPTRAIIALSLLIARRVPILQPGRTTNPARPINLKAKLS